MKMDSNKLLKQSQFHGGRRLAERECSSRWYWYISMAFLFGSAVAVVQAIVQRFYQNPTFMLQLQSVANLSQFPSVTVCPEIYYQDDVVDRFLENLKIPPHLNRTYLRSVTYTLAAYYSPDMVYRTQDLKNVEDLLEYNDIPVEVASRAMTTSCESTLLKCRWQSIMVNCSDLFTMELTGDGYCCVFNGRSLARELYGGNKPFLWNKQSSALRYGLAGGLMIAVNQSQFEPTSVDLSYKWLAIQAGQHYVESTINGSALSPDVEHWAEYQPHNFQIADDARGMSHSLRKCRMKSERLQFFPLYNQRYCGVECERAHTLKRCGCVRMVHPRTEGVRLCTSHQLLCARHAMVSHDSEVCNCPAACDVAWDIIKLSSYRLYSSVKPIDKFYEGLNFSTTSVVRVFTRSSVIKTDVRVAYFSNTDLFAQLGGVFNAFFGCSVLSLLELTIMVLHRIYFIVKSIRKEKIDKNNQAKKETALKDYKITS